MYEQVTLHAGVPRTGTTTIQFFLDVNRRPLRSRGFFYAGPTNLNSYGQELGFWQEDRLRGGLEEIKRQAKNDGASGVLWSNEGLATDFFVRDPKCLELVRRELPASRYRVVIYLRRQDHFLRSAYLQWGIKFKDYPGPALDFNAWMQRWLGDQFQCIREAGLDYFSLLQPWIDVFGRENVVIRAFEKEQFVDGSLLHDFCGAADIAAEECTFRIPNRNVSFSMELYDMLRMYSAAFTDSSRSRKMATFIEAEGLDKFYSSDLFSKFTIPAQCRLEILRRCEESNRKVAEELLGRENGVLFYEPWPAPEEPYQAYGGLITEKLVPMLLHMLQKQDERIVELDERLHKFEMDAKEPTIAKTARRIVGKLTRGVKSVTTLGKE
jgi:hypothetical protein